MYICVNVHMYTCIYVYMYICAYVYIPTSIYVCMYICIHVYMYISRYVYMYICIHVYMYICIHIYTGPKKHILFDAYSLSAQIESSQNVDCRSKKKWDIDMSYTFSQQYIFKKTAGKW